VRVRLEREGQSLFDELRELNTLLQELIDYFAPLQADTGVQNEIELLRHALNEMGAQEHAYPTLRRMATRVARLRERAYSSLQLLQRMRQERGSEKSYQAIRQRIRAYISWQLMQEGQLIQASFEGFGPRR
jgi:hypothetical protein